MRKPWNEDVCKENLKKLYPKIYILEHLEKCLLAF